MSDAVAPKRRGRPALPAHEKKRRNVTFRLRDSFREELERRATDNGRSMSEEIETLLEKFVPLSDVITKQFVEDIRSVVSQNDDMQRDRKSLAEIALWNASLLRNNAKMLRQLSKDLEVRSKLYAQIEAILRDHDAENWSKEVVDQIIIDMSADLEQSIAACQELGNVPDMPSTADLRDARVIEQKERDLGVQTKFSKKLLSAIAIKTNLSDIRYYEWPKSFDDLPSDITKGLLKEHGDDVEALYAEFLTGRFMRFAPILKNAEGKIEQTGRATRKIVSRRR